MMGLIDDDEIELAREEAISVLTPPRGGDRGNDAVLIPKRLRILAHASAVGRGKGQAELVLQLLLPLADEGGWRQYQGALSHAAQRVFLEHHTGFNGLAESHLVGEQNAATKLLEHLAHGLDLMQQGLEAGEVRQAQKLVESLRQPEMGEPFAQSKPVTAVLRLLRDTRR